MADPDEDLLRALCCPNGCKALDMQADTGGACEAGAFREELAASRRVSDQLLGEILPGDQVKSRS